MKGFISIDQLDKRLQTSGMRKRTHSRPDRDSVKAFDVCLGNDGKLVPVMYYAETASALTSIKDVQEIGPIGNKIIDVTLNEAQEVFGKTATEILINVQKVKTRKELLSLLSI